MIERVAVTYVLKKVVLPTPSSPSKIILTITARVGLRIEGSDLLAKGVSGEDLLLL
jgi:hypothetical protein